MKITTGKKQDLERNRSRRVRSSEQPARSESFSFYRSKRLAPDDRAESKIIANRRIGITKARITIIVLLTIVLVVLELPVNSNPQIQVASPGGGLSSSQSSTIRAASEQIISSSVFNRTKLTFDSSTVERKLEAKFPNILYAKVSFSAFSYSPTIHLHLRQPDLILKSSSASYVVDHNGIAYAELSRTRLDSNLPSVTDKAAGNISIGQQVLPSSYVGFIKSLSYQFDASGEKASSLALKGGTTELDVELDGKKYFVKFNLMGDARTEVGAFIASARYLAKRGVTPNSYLDVRVPGKVYYK